MSNATDGFRSTGGGGSTIAFPQNPLDPSAGERGLSGNDFPNALGIGFTYNVPNLLKAKRAAWSGREWLSFERHISVSQRPGLYSVSTVNPRWEHRRCKLLRWGIQRDVIGVDTCRLVLSNTNAPSKQSPT